MCGRFVSTNSPERISAYFGASFEAEPLGENFNVAPTNDVLAVVAGGDGPAVRAFHWGLVPTWAKDAKIGSKMINARAETVMDKPAFREAFRSHRCIVPVTSIDRWRRRKGSGKSHALIRRRDGTAMGLAGLWSTWTDPAIGDEVTTFAVITCKANALLADLHDRMPVILDPTDYNLWLDPARGGQELLRPCPDAWLEVVSLETKGRGAMVEQAQNRESEGQGRLF